MKLIVNSHKIEIEKTPVNEREIDVTKCEFEFADEITNDYVKEAYFTFNGKTYKEIIVNNECNIPSEVLVEKGQVEIGVVAFKVENEEEIKRYNPSPAYFNTWLGSLKDKVENSEPITPTDKEQMESQILSLQNGKINVSDIVDNLNSIETQKPLSANQGKELKNLIDGISFDVFLDGITYEENYDTISKTTYYTTSIPIINNLGNQNKWKLGLPYDDITLSSSESPIDFAINKNASICINGGIGSSTNIKKPHGILIKDGVILKDELYTTNPCKVLGIKEDGSFMTFPSATTTAQEVLDAGCVNALVGWDTFIENGQSVTYAPSNGASANPRQAICRKKNGDYLIFTCNGREQDDVGMTIADMQRILLARGDIDFAYNLDGGGSASTIVDLQKINKNIDNHYEDRKVYTFFYMEKQPINTMDLTKIFGIVSKLRQEINERLVNLEVLNSVIKIYSDDASSQIEFYNNGERKKRTGRLQLNEQGLNLRWIPPATEETPEPEEMTLMSATDTYLRYKGVPFGNFMNYCTNTASETDLNDITKQGLYKCTSSTLNRPRTGTYIILHINQDSNYTVKYQIALPVGNNYMFARNYSSNSWSDWKPIGILTGNTNGRPATWLTQGQMYFDTTLGKPIWYDGSKWVDATGTQV